MFIPTWSVPRAGANSLVAFAKSSESQKYWPRQTRARNKLGQATEKPTALVGKGWEKRHVGEYGISKVPKYLRESRGPYAYSEKSLKRLKTVTSG